MANEKVKVEFKEKRLDKDGRHVEKTATKMVPAKFRKHFKKWGWKEIAADKTAAKGKAAENKPEPKTEE